MEFRAVGPDELLDAAERHARGLAKAMAWNDTESLNPGEVIDAVRQNRAVFLEAILDGRPIGGVVVQFVNSEILHVWMAWRSAPGGSAREWWRLLCGMARDREFKTVSAMSSRPLDRLLNGMLPRATVYEAAL